MGGGGGGVGEREVAGQVGSDGKGRGWKVKKQRRYAKVKKRQYYEMGRGSRDGDERKGKEGEENEEIGRI